MSGRDRPVWLGEDGRGWDHVRVHVQVIEDDRLGAHEQAVYLALTKHAEGTSGGTWVGQHRLAEYTRLSWSSVHRALGKLATLRYVGIEGRQGQTSVYRLLPPPPLSDSEGSPGTQKGGSCQGRGGTPVTDADEREPGNESHELALSLVPAAPSESASSSSALAAPEDNLWRAIAEALGTPTASSRAKFDRAVEEIRAAGGQPDEVADRVANLRKRWSRGHVTPKSLAEHWPTATDGSGADRMKATAGAGGRLSSGSLTA